MQENVTSDETKRPKSKPVKFTGTALEVECFLRRFYDGAFVLAESVMENIDENGDPRDEALHKAALDAFERTVWTITLEQGDGVAKQQARPEWAEQVELMKAERELSSSIHRALTAIDMTSDESGE